MERGLWDEGEKYSTGLTVTIIRRKGIKKQALKTTLLKRNIRNPELKVSNL